MVSAYTSSVYTSWSTWNEAFGVETLNARAVDDLLRSQHTKSLVKNVTNHACNRYGVPFDEREDFEQECMVLISEMASKDERLTKARRLIAPDRALMAFMADRVKSIVEHASYLGVSGPTTTRIRRRRRLESMRRDVYQATGDRLSDEDLVARYNEIHSDNPSAARSGLYPAAVDDLRDMRPGYVDDLLHSPSAPQVSHENDDTELVAASSPLGVAATNLAMEQGVPEVALVMAELMVRADSAGNLFDIEAVAMATKLPLTRVRAALPVCLELIAVAARDLGLHPVAS